MADMVFKADSIEEYLKSPRYKEEEEKIVEAGCHFEAMSETGKSRLLAFFEELKAVDVELGRLEEQELIDDDEIYERQKPGNERLESLVKELVESGELGALSPSQLGLDHSYGQLLLTHHHRKSQLN